MSRDTRVRRVRVSWEQYSSVICVKLVLHRGQCVLEKTYFLLEAFTELWRFPVVIMTTVRAARQNFFHQTNFILWSLRRHPLLMVFRNDLRTPMILSTRIFLVVHVGLMRRQDSAYLLVSRRIEVYQGGRCDRHTLVTTMSLLLRANTVYSCFSRH